MLSKTLKLVLLGIAVAVTSSLSSLKLFGQATSELVPNVPLSYTSLVWDASSLDPDSADGQQWIKQGARRADGSTVVSTLQTTTDGSFQELRTVIDLSSARTTLVDSTARSVTPVSMSEQAVLAKQAPMSCGGMIVGERLGVDVVLLTAEPPVQLGVVSRHGRMHTEQFVAPELGCLVMETRMIMTYPDGTERVVRSDRVVDIDVGEPDQSMFRIPLAYQEMSPMERMNVLGRGADAANDVLLQSVEQTYQARKGR